jgi:hypothetical protein
MTLVEESKSFNQHSCDSSSFIRSMINPGIKNSSPNGWAVQKFGGTSVGKFPDRIAENIIRYTRRVLELSVRSS